MLFSGSSPLAQIDHLLRRKYFLAAAVRSVFFGKGDSFALALADQCPLKFSEGKERIELRPFGILF